MAENTSSGRRPIEVVQIDQDQCTLTYGTAPCTADITTGGHKCFNTIGTCQDLTNYTAGTLTLNFITNQSVIPDDGNYYMPFLKKVSVTPGKINPGGGNKSAAALGQRSSMSISLMDAPHSDIKVDKYVAERLSGAAQDDGIGYDPFERSTFWVKWKARNKYYLHRQVRYISGYLLDGQIVDSITRTFFLTGMTGPTAKGGVTFTAKDVLTLINDDKAKAPVQSTGSLSAGITNVATSATLTPAGIGALEYPASGKVRISNEVCSFTRAADVLTITRAQHNTDAKAHDAGDTVQLCLEYSGARPDDILEDLLTTYSGIDSAFLDTVEWAAEVNSFMPRLYSTLITDPVGVKALISEMCDQMYFYTWFDERESLVKMRAVRPAEDEDVTQLTGDRHVIADSMAVADATDQLITQVWVNYAQLDPTKQLTDLSNYAATEVIGDFVEEEDDRQGSSKIKTINSRWISAAAGATAIDLGEKLLARYSDVPKRMSFSLDAKDRDVWVGDFVQVSTRLVTDDVGVERPVNLQIFAASEKVTGSVFSYSGQEFVNEVPPDPNDRLIIISADLTNVNLRTLHDSLFPPPVGTEVVRVIVRNGVTIGGEVENQSYTSSVLGANPAPQTIAMSAFQTDNETSPTFYGLGDTIPWFAGGSGSSFVDLWAEPRTIAMDTGTWPVGTTLSLEVEGGGAILGAGGAGNAFLNTGIITVIGNGSDGGHALNVQYAIEITNLGIIGGGGGAGSSAGFHGSLAIPGDPISWQVLTYSGGGAGYLAGTSAVYEINNGPNVGPGVTTTLLSSTTASAGSASAGGTGSFVSFNNTTLFENVDKTATAGNGGALGVDGGDAVFAGFVAGVFPVPVGTGGEAGNAVKSGASMITWVNKGDVRGAEA